MNFQFYPGPDKIPFRVIAPGKVNAIAVLFNGIISRGLLNKFIEQEIDFKLWHKYAHLLFENEESCSDDEFNILKNSATECRMLSFGQSAYCVQRYTENYCKNVLKTDAEIELWNIKEGHTSTVWKVTVRSELSQKVFAVNVSRDYEAGIELKETSEKLLTISNQYPELNIAKVLDIYTLYDNSLPSEVIITRNEWIDNAYEIHLRQNPATKEDELIMVERFLTRENNPAFITSAVGKVFDQFEKEKILDQIKYFLKMASTCLHAAPEININDGDIIWEGEKAIVIAIS